VPIRTTEPGSGTVVSVVANLRSSITYWLAALEIATDAMPVPSNSRKPDVPVVPSVFASPVTEPSEFVPESYAVIVIGFRLVNQKLTTDCGESNTSVIGSSNALQTTTSPECGG